MVAKETNDFRSSGSEKREDEREEKTKLEFTLSSIILVVASLASRKWGDRKEKEEEKRSSIFVKFVSVSSIYKLRVARMYGDMITWYEQSYTYFMALLKRTPWIEMK